MCCMCTYNNAQFLQTMLLARHGLVYCLESIVHLIASIPRMRGRESGAGVTGSIPGLRQRLLT
jgi:hypothetical protein